ncbi:gag/pol/env polyprotein, putative [Perkinsus marinus ATCC 50983]|uniref:Gag/pol/env polyprotein, putative n=1 Tax=Perkinsus marinus (strain ATCC 50983 / TXsc) TaxID=423536 RepID=C5K4L4_PERM5|nr:gag/pol/env polyprotein, putative [Perkinsus marinus ATCC 50983]EER20581.1 gag/pol/env polyprotein, putative [Perkinsus marinus ATCC 50983]|eukprot:XP_002788785.1 gag/pol/env polyprotein, putative [Perkinsus marinus ATCC 50983]
MSSEGETSEGEGQEELSEKQCECLVGQKEDVERDWFEVFADRVGKAQLSDDFCVLVSSELRANSKGKYSTHYRLEEKTGMLLCRRWDASEKEVEWIVYIPANRRDLQLEVVHKFHHTFLHPGIGRTVRLIRKFCWWKGIHQRVRSFVLSCDACCRAKEGRLLNKCLPSVRDFVPLVWGIAGLDVWGPIRLGSNATSWLRCVNELFGRDIVTGVSEIMAENGVFRVCVTDQAQYFVSKRFREYLASRSVVHCVTEAYDEERRGWYERSHKELTVTLRAMVSEGQAMDSINQVRQRLALFNQLKRSCRREKIDEVGEEPKQSTTAVQTEPKQTGDWGSVKIDRKDLRRWRDTVKAMSKSGPGMLTRGKKRVLEQIEEVSKAPRKKL